MSEVKCKCGNKGCSTSIRINFTGIHQIDLQLSWKEKGSEKYQTIALDANSIVELIYQLKMALSELG